jgi:hypothetical protein
MTAVVVVIALAIPMVGAANTEPVETDGVVIERVDEGKDVPALSTDWAVTI